MNSENSTRWLQSVHDALARLAGRSSTLLVVLLALNAVVRPYGNLMHDARLYGLLAVNRAEHGAYTEDLFLRFGSQDQYSLFSPIVAPFVQAVGVRPAFFVLYLACNAIFFFAAIRLARALIPSPAAAVLSLCYLAAVPIPYSALRALHVHETFLTPRSLAIPLVMLSLERLLAFRPWRAATLLAFAFLVHPLAAFGGVLVAVGFWTWHFLSFRSFVALLSVAITAAYVAAAIPSIGFRIFGAMDDDWHALVRTGTRFCFTNEWDCSDWIDLSVAFAVLLWAILWRVTPPLLRRLLILIGLVSIAGIVGSVVATHSHYALLLQAQPFRVLWLLQTVKVMLGGWLILLAFQSRSEWPKLLALPLLAYALIGSNGLKEMGSMLLAAPMVFLVRWKYPHVLGGREIWTGIAWSVLAAGVLLAVRQTAFILAERDVMLGSAAPHLVVVCWLVSIGPTVWISMTAILAWRLDRMPGRVAGQVLTLVAWLALTLQGLSFAQDAIPRLRDHATMQAGDLAFAGSFVQKQGRSADRLPVVYQGLGRFEAVWFDWRCVGYYDSWQIAGQMFHRSTAIEGSRRRQLVEKFEASMLRSKLSHLDQLGDIAPGFRKMGVNLDLAAATIDDLARLCMEPALDYVIVEDEFPGLYAASNGRVHVYDCKQVRSLLRLPEPSASGRIASQ